MEGPSSQQDAQAGDAPDGVRFGEEGRHRLAPHRVRQFKVSTDPNFTDKTYDVTGLHTDPPARAVVF